jgi:hypothetical protein
MASISELLAAGRGKGRRFVSNEVLKAAQERAEKAANERATAFLEGYLGKFDGEVDDAVELYKELRRQATAQGKYAEKLSRATAYFNDKGNPLPIFKVKQDTYGAQTFCRGVGIDVPEEGDPAWVVPAEWIEPVAPGAEAPAA